MKFIAVVLCTLLAACMPGARPLASQQVKNAQPENIAGCYLRDSGTAWLLLRDDHTARFGDQDGSRESNQKWFIQDSAIIFGNPEEINFNALDVYLVPGSGYVLSDNVSLFNSAPGKSCGP